MLKQRLKQKKTPVPEEVKSLESLCELEKQKKLLIKLPEEARQFVIKLPKKSRLFVIKEPEKLE